MSDIQAVIHADGDSAVVTLIAPGDDRSPYVAREDHPNFKAIVGAVLEHEYDGITALFNIADTIALKFQRLSERVTVEDDAVYFDGVEVNSALTQQILAVLNSGATDASWVSLVNFFENVQTNPSESSREALYVWINAHQERNGLTITEDGYIVGYKGVRSDPEHGYRSINSGNEPVRVDDVVYTGRIPNPLGAVVEMPRTLVDPNSDAYCSVGLHVGTYEYARSFGGGLVIEVHVNPRDVVAVPADAGGQKVRTCRYTVVDAIEAAYDSPVLYNEDDTEDGDEFAPGTVVEAEGDAGVVLDESDDRVAAIWIEQGYIPVEFDDGDVDYYMPDDLTVLGVDEDPARCCDECDCDDLLFDNPDQDGTYPSRVGSGKIHGKGGKSSSVARGRGKNPAQNALGRFSAGRPGSRRDPKTGRFA